MVPLYEAAQQFISSVFPVDFHDASCCSVYLPAIFYGRLKSRVVPLNSIRTCVTSTVQNAFVTVSPLPSPKALELPAQSLELVSHTSLFVLQNVRTLQRGHCELPGAFLVRAILLVVGFAHAVHPALAVEHCHVLGHGLGVFRSTGKRNQVANAREAERQQHRAASARLCVAMRRPAVTRVSKRVVLTRANRRAVHVILLSRAGAPTHNFL